MTGTSAPRVPGQRPPGRRTTSGWVLGSVGRTPVVLAPSWLLIAAVLTVLVLPTVSALVPGTPTALLTTVGFVAMLFISVLVHELAHGLTAQRAGTRPREYVITFWGGHTAFERELASPGASAWVSAAGPLANLVLAALAWAAAELTAPLLPVPALLLLWGAVLANVFVGAFNLLPGSPLDGGRVLEAVVWRLTGDRLRGTVAAAWGGRVIVVGLVLFFFAWPVARGERPGLGTAVWVLLLAGMLWTGATRSLRYAQAQRTVADLDLRQLATPAVTVPAGATVAEADARLTGEAAVVLVEDARPVAVVDGAAARTVPARLRATTGVSAVAQRLPDTAVLTELTGPAAVAAAGRAGRLAVLVDGGRVVGVLPLDRLLAELTRRDPRRRR
ncbi:site-2 protease family protein [Georgenia sp. 10Sc9-8]|uniref:Site-2 protease family protein n=1 Tax=Georgenia halotolerans TaxID=3028317 RepID=A0ABT5TZW5_9MICO|nr:site-2 protease family protein [Georgenia halotolerans]